MNYFECANALRQRDSFLILTHKNPDGDTAGSAGALCSALRRMGKSAYMYSNPQFTKKLLPYVGEFIAPADFKGECTVAVDIAEEKLFAEGFSGKIDYCIDHHPTNTLYAGDTLLHAEKASCGEIILELLTGLGLEPTQKEATLLYIAESTDTGCFLYANTSAETFSSAAKLIGCGADKDKINLDFFRKVSPARIRLEGMIYSSMRFFRDDTVAFAVITKEMLEKSGVQEDDLDDIASLAGRNEKAIVSITVREKPEHCRVSVRSGPQVSSSDICARFNGGGHRAAAGCTIKAAPDEAVELLMKAVNEVWQ